MNVVESQELAEAIRVEIVNVMNFTGQIKVAATAARPWASALFCGAQHSLQVTFDGPGAVGAAAEVLDRLFDLDVALPGQFLADLALGAEQRGDNGAYARLDLEALTIEE